MRMIRRKERLLMIFKRQRQKMGTKTMVAAPCPIAMVLRRMKFATK
jgi:hypothetical protein